MNSATLNPDRNSALAERTIGGLHAHLLRKIDGLSPVVTADTPILDIGCGTGAWLDRLADHGLHNLHGIDRDIRQFAATRATCTEIDIRTGGYQYDD